MPAYRYKILRADGATAEGELEASSRADAFHQIDERGWRALRLDDPPPAPTSAASPMTGW